MTKKRRTRRALINSVISLLICFSMLLGTTFAWFTDTVTSGSNVITSGNLDIAVEYTLDGKNWADLDNAEDLFQKGLWEPGHTEVVALKITNKGSLALKYTANMNLVNEVVGKTKDSKDIVLSDILTVNALTQQVNQVGDISVMLAFSSENAANIWSSATKSTFKDANILGDNVELMPGDAHYVLVKVDMAETVGNEANHNGTNKPSIEFGINVLATQFTYEEDSFGNQYDKDAEYPVVMVSTADDLKEATTDIEEDTTIFLTEDITMADGAAIQTNGSTGAITIDGNGKTIESTASSVDVFTWENGTIPAMSTILSSSDGSTVTVNNTNFSGTMSALMLGNYVDATYNNFNTVLNNVNVIDAKVVSFSQNIAPAVCVYGTATMSNCSIYGSTLSELDTDPAWPVYDVAVTNYSDLTIDNSEIGSVFMWNQAKVTVANGSEVETIVIRGNMNTSKPEYCLTVKDGAVVNIIDLSAITDKARVNITVEDGATVGSYVANGVTYTSIEEWKNAI